MKAKVSIMGEKAENSERIWGKRILCIKLEHIFLKPKNGAEPTPSCSWVCVYMVCEGDPCFSRWPKTFLLVVVNVDANVCCTGKGEVDLYTQRE